MDIDIEIQFPNSDGVYGASYDVFREDAKDLMKWFVLESSGAADDEKNLEKINEYEWSMIPFNGFSGDPQFIFSIYRMTNMYPGVTIKADLDKFYKQRERKYKENLRFGVLS